MRLTEISKQLNIPLSVLSRIRKKTPFCARDDMDLLSLWKLRIVLAIRETVDRRFFMLPIIRNKDWFTETALFFSFCNPDTPRFVILENGIRPLRNNAALIEFINTEKFVQVVKINSSFKNRREGK